MMNFIRPEIRVFIWRWRETLIGALLVLLGSSEVFGGTGLMVYVGIAVLVMGIVLVFLGLQRGRFRGEGDGPGSVDVDEGQIIYFGPMTGGSMALRDIVEIALLRTGVTAHWRLRSEADELYIPVNADGADALFDAFTALPDLKVERMLASLRNPDPHDTVIWSRGPSRPAHQTLH